jgi:hypothetical protein
MRVRSLVGDTRSIARLSATCLALASLAGATGCANEENEKQPSAVVPQAKSVPRQPSVRRHKRKSAYARCDAQIRVKRSTTSCAFGENVFWTYWSFPERHAQSVWSPAVQDSFKVTCRESEEEVRCRTPERASVRFSLAAVDEYTQRNADHFAEGHDLGPDPYENPYERQPVREDPAPDDSASGCEPGYSPCLDSGVGDYDCEGGSGDGPNYTGEVEVTGSDPFGLDRDGNGIGCQS